MKDETKPTTPPPSQNPPPKQKRSMLTTVIVLIVLLGFFWLTRQRSEDTTTNDEQPVAEQLPAPAEPAVEDAEASEQVDVDASEGVDSEETVAAESEPADSDAPAGASDTALEVGASSEESASGPRAPPGMSTITLAELPPEALETIALIENNGPFPYSKDGSTFQNREGILPSQSNGYYSEYTVETPGSSDRGARRIVGGAEGELYYTDDHYSSFSWVEQ